MYNYTWILDRLPTAQDGDYYGQVWDSEGNLSFTHEIAEGEPWMPSNCPGMYINASWNVQSILDEVHLCHPRRGCFQLMELSGSSFEHMQAAKRIAAIYEELMP